jgi:hypothetical protein
MNTASRTVTTKLIHLALVFGFSVISAIGCQVEEDVGTPEPQVGQILIRAEPDALSPGWVLRAPDGSTTRGAGDAILEGLEPGEYSLVWDPISGYASPRPNPSTSQLSSGRTVIFTGNYAEMADPTGSVSIDPDPDELRAPWVVSGPDGFVAEGEGDELLEGRAVGIYVVIWGDVPGRETPTLQQAVLAEGEVVRFPTTYIELAPPALGSINIDTQPNSISAPWRLDGPSGYQQFGQGDAYIEDREPGSYTLTWEYLSGFDRPSPFTITRTLAEGGNVDFYGEYTDQLPPPTGAPSITDVAGQASNGGSMTLSGADFGGHTMLMESSVGPNGWIESNSVGTPGNQLSGSSWETTSSTVPAFIDNSRAHSGSKSINASINRAADGDWQKTFYYVQSNRFDKLYATWWVYFNPVQFGDQTQWKMWRVGDTSHSELISNDNCASLYQTSVWYPGNVLELYETTFHCMKGCAWPGQRDCYANILPSPYYPPTDGDPYYYNVHNRGATEPYTANLPTVGVWCRMEFFLQASDIDTPNGKYWLAIHKPGQPRKIIDNWVDGLLTKTSSCCEDESQQWENFVLQGYFDDNGGGYQNEIADLFYDDIYLQFGTEARVELGDTDVYSECSQLEIQEIVDWQSGQISLRLNHGAFNAGTQKFLFVINQNGLASRGIAVNLQ